MELCRPESDGRRYGWTMNLFSNASRILQSWRTAFAFSVACGALWVASAGAAWADPPARAGRIADVTGTAWLFDPEAKAWVRVLRNQTIGQGDQMRTDARSRVTVRVGSSTVWLDEQSDMEVLQMDDAGTMLRVAAGDVALRLRTAQTAQETRIQTREGVISPEMEGLFRVDQLDRGSRLAVLQGRAQFDSDPGAPVQRAWLREGEQAEFWWAESPRIERQAVSRDKFSAWFLAQDQAEGALALGDDALCVSRNDRCRGLEPKRQLGSGSRVRQRLDTHPRGCRLGALPRRPLGLDTPMGLELGGQRALGFCTLPLRPLDTAPRPLGLGTGSL